MRGGVRPAPVIRCIECIGDVLGVVKYKRSRIIKRHEISTRGKTVGAGLGRKLGGGTEALAGEEGIGGVIEALPDDGGGGIKEDEVAGVKELGTNGSRRRGGGDLERLSKGGVIEGEGDGSAGEVKGSGGGDGVVGVGHPGRVIKGRNREGDGQIEGRIGRGGGEGAEGEGKGGIVGYKRRR